MLFHEIILCADDSEECTQGFLNSSSIDETNSRIAAFPDSSLSNTDPAALSDFTQWIFPDINFTCNGYIIKWRLRVNDGMESVTEIMQRPSPHITTWKLQPEISFGSISNYVLKSSTNESQINVIMMNGSVYYEYTPSLPIRVQVGDIVGIMIPSDESDRLRSVKPLFLRLPEQNSSTISSCVRLGDSQQILLENRACSNPQEQQSRYIPLLSAIFSELPI